MPFAVAAGIGAAATIYSSSKANKTARAGIDAQSEAAADANELSKEQFEWNKWV